MHCKSFDTWRTSILDLRRELLGRGLGDRIRIAGPDTVWANNWIKKVADDPELASAIGAYEVHSYAKDREIEDGVHGREMKYWRQYIDAHDRDGKSKKFFMGEAGMLTGKSDEFDVQTYIATFEYGVWMADFAIQSMRSGQAGVIAWALDDGMLSTDGLGSDVDVRAVHWKEWGFWDSFGEEKGKPWLTAPRPWFHVWSLLSRYVPPGSSVLSTSESGIPGLRGTGAAFTRAGRRHYTFAVVNEANEARQVRVVLAGVKTEPVPMNQYDYFVGDVRRDADGLPIVSRVIESADLAAGVTVQMPGKGAIILTSDS
jgi:hypothetical protein